MCSIIERSGYPNINGDVRNSETVRRYGRAIVDVVARQPCMVISAQQIGIFALAERKLAWLDDRQRVLSQNIANSDTPGYRSRDVAAFDTLVSSFQISPTQTNPMHLAGNVANFGQVAGRPAERAPDGNAVEIEGEMTKVADDETSQALVGNIWRTYMGMFMTALGHSG